MDLALIEEINKDYIKAVKYYEEEIKNKKVLPATYINLAFLYWSFAFDYFGFDIPNNIPDDYSIIGGNRYSIILELGLKQYPNNAELNFWKRYFQHIIFSEDFSNKDCKELLEKYKDGSLAPYFFLYLFDKEKYREKMIELMDEINNCPTAKNLYIKSIIGRDFH